MKNQTGQIGLVVLLISAVLLTIGIGVASESVQVQKTTRQETESTETFGVAEDAMEWALGQELTADSFVYDGTPQGWNVSVQKESDDSFAAFLGPGESGQIDLTGADEISVSWNSGGSCAATPSVIVTLLSATDLERYAYGPDCRLTDGFSAITGPIYSQDITVTGYDLARVKVVYASGEITVSGNLGPQQYTFTSTAAKESGETRAVQTTRGLPAVPSIFDYAVFAGVGSIAVTP